MKNEYNQPVTPQNIPYVQNQNALFERYYTADDMNKAYNDGRTDAGTQCADIISQTEQMVLGFTDSIKQFNYERERNKQDIIAVQKENNMLRMSIANMKKYRTELEREFWIDTDGTAWCNDINGTKKKIGKISIKRIANYSIYNNNKYINFIKVDYTDSKSRIRTTMVSENALTKKELIENFPGFEYVCKSRQLASDFLAYEINRLSPEFSTIIGKYAGFTVYTENDIEKADFICNIENISTDIMKYYPQNIIDRRLTCCDKNITAICEELHPYVNTNEKFLLFTFGICGILSSLLNNIGYKISQYLVIDSPNYNSSRIVAIYMKLYNRAKECLSFDSNITRIRKAFESSNDETIIITDCNNIDNVKRRRDIVASLLAFDTECDSQHNTAIISHTAQYLIPKEKKICLTLSHDFGNDISIDAEHELVTALNDAVCYIIIYVCKHYSDIKAIIKKSIYDHQVIEKGFGYPEMPNIQSQVSWRVLSAVCNLLNKFFQFPSITDMDSYIMDLLLVATEKNGDNTDAVVDDFTKKFNQAIRNGKIQLLYYNQKEHKPDDFMRGNNQLLVDGDALAVEIDTIETIILPNMNTSKSTNCILKSLSDDGLIQKQSNGNKKTYTKKWTVSENRCKKRIPIIEFSVNDILDTDTELMAFECRYAEWFTAKPDIINFIPVITNSVGNLAGQIIDLKKDTNLHYFAAGVSGSGKTHSLTERLASIQKAGFSSVVFDTSNSFDKSSIIEHLAADGNKDVLCTVEQYVDEHFTFISLEDDGIPVEPFKIECDNIKDVISAIVTSHYTGTLGSVQSTLLSKKLTAFVESGDYSAANLYDTIAGGEYPDKQETLQQQLQEHLSCFWDYDCTDITWKELFSKSKDVIVISMKSSSKPGGFALIDMLMMSLFYYQRQNKSMKLSIFIDEIQNQNLKPCGPITQILREGRKFRTSLNYATQTECLSNKEVTAVIKQAGLLVYFRPDDASMSAVSRSLVISKEELNCLNVGECYIKGEVYNYKKGKVETKVLHGRTYRNFVPFKSQT